MRPGGEGEDEDEVVDVMRLTSGKSERNIVVRILKTVLFRSLKMTRKCRSLR